MAIDDFQKLLSQACYCDVKLNPEVGVGLEFFLKLDSTLLGEGSSENTNSNIQSYPLTNYSWLESKTKDGRRLLMLKSPTVEGISCGLYGFLQEKIGFKFIHPRETVIPVFTQWIQDKKIDWTAEPRFNKRGFHLHTMHPLELTEQLLDETYPNALNDVKEYIDWLARNGQNYFEFNLQEDVNRKEWIPHAKAFVEYAHQRGIKVGVDLSLHMIQQKAFQLYKGAGNKKKQIDKNMAWLNQVDWDQWSMEFSKTEFNSGNVKKKMELQLHVTKQLTEKYGIKLMGRKHVVKPSEELGKAKSHKVYEMTEEEKVLDASRGILMHTVMFYSSVEEKAPVYRNENLRHIYEGLVEEQKVRETWYYPESAYWITFDNSVPMTLLPYLNARLEDIKVMDSLNVEGHLTFSSGWEWGYWLFDWSIARWSWSHTNNGVEQENFPTQYLHDLFPDKEVQQFFDDVTNLQQSFIKDQELIRYLCPSSVTDEFPAPYNLEFQPRPSMSYKYISKKAPIDFLYYVRDSGIRLGDKFYFANKSQVDKMRALDFSVVSHKNLLEELLDGIEITGLRAMHRASTLEYLCSRNGKNVEFGRPDFSMAQAGYIRQNAQKIVDRREQNYRYPVESLARKHKSHTAYEFGYLYPVSNLHFWKREEMQALKSKWSPFYMNIFDLRKIIGIKN